MQQQREAGVIAGYYDLRGFGFIAMNGAESGDIFVHPSEMADPVLLREGTRVTFVLTDTPKGPRASAVEAS